MIFFVQCEGIMRVSASGGTPELAIKANEDETFDGPHLLPDGDSVLFSLTTGTGRTQGTRPGSRCSRFVRSSPTPS